jgi:hypothetical protein
VSNAPLDKAPRKRSLVAPGEAAARLGCSRSFVYTLCAMGRLESYLERPNAVHSRRLVVLASVERYLKEHGPIVARNGPKTGIVPTKERGLIAARLFRAFDAGVSLRAIVVQYEVDPSWVRQLYREWSQDLVHANVERAEREHRREQTRADRLASQEAHRQHQRQMKRIEADAQKRAAEAAARILARESGRNGAKP